MYSTFTRTLKAEIITIGDELLIGQTIDTNAAWMAGELAQIGVHVEQITSIKDTKKHIIDTLNDVMPRADLILLTGGLGPTKDDITKHTLCEYFDTTLELNEEVLEAITKRFAEFKRPMLAVNTAQAKLPKACTVIRNWHGTASGMWFEHEGKVVVSMPGVPYEMKGLMSGEILEKVKAHFETGNVSHFTIQTQGEGESFMAETISDIEDELKNNDIKLAYLPAPGQVRMRLTKHGGVDAENQILLKKFADQIIERFPRNVFGTGDDTLEQVVGKLLKDTFQTVAVAESCTGGYLSHLFTSVAGSSEYFMGAVIAYHNDIKHNELGVDEVDLRDQGAVSEPVVLQMAEGIRRKYKTTYGVATSGIAGPTGERPGKPVGTIWIAVAGPKGSRALCFSFGNNRARNIRKAALTALNMLRLQAV